MTGGLTCDTSVLVPVPLSWHENHLAARHAVLGEVQHVPAHVLLECYSVLTRLPAPLRVSAESAADVVARLPMAALVLPADVHRGLVADLGRARIGGGALYDALVAATARHHGLRLLTRDRRARTTYDVVGMEYTVL
ncbi:type II toxin-antitoxin system VapC family toxin [Georgenia sp. H159]|uniref:type II toxin-antitoxin system VapC family toxin n=1 Tax=Georgenia sp. H159 TaxID=3076115 RepID=UPI002D7682DB|nr:type II toxin-antitoxin system VapC family toxin [Georgenia sp. H159]